MKILLIGDISAKPGRETVAQVLPGIKAKYQPDLVVANCENAAHGKGVTSAILAELQGYGVDYFTSGDHIWSRSGFTEEMNDANLPVLRPYNYEGQQYLPGKGYYVLDMGSKGRVVLANFIGQVFMDEHIRSALRNPLWAADDLLSELASQGISRENASIIIDFHAEATAEKLVFANYLKDKVTAVVGTHTHVPTADERLMGNMAYVSDLGMVGAYDSSLWMTYASATNNAKFPTKVSAEIEENGRMVFNSVLVEIAHNKAVSIKRIDKILEKI